VHPVFLLTGCYFVIGGLAIVFINRRPGASGKAERWTKYAVYFLIVHLVIAAILSGGSFVALAAAILGLGLHEIVRAATTSAKRPVRTLAAVLPVYAALGFAFIRFASGTRASMILFVYVVVLTFDGFCQITGQLLGRHKLAPRVSPGKTWEGFAAGMAGAALAAVFGAMVFGLPMTTWLAACVPVALLSVVGDLVESMFKRRAGLKDSGGLLPGHGGVLDRVDGLTAAGPAFLLALQLIGVAP
jgi:phosphatidate cytidylyltransferase